MTYRPSGRFNEAADLPGGNPLGEPAPLHPQPEASMRPPDLPGGNIAYT